MRARKIKLDDYEIKVAINGLYRYRKDASDEVQDVIDPIILRLIRVLKDLKPGKRTKLPFSPEEKHLIRFNLNGWRNQLIRENNLGGMDNLTEVMLSLEK
jgi:hypothetical protein